MASYMRRVVVRKLLQSIQVKRSNQLEEVLASIIRVTSVSKKYDVCEPQLYLSLEDLNRVLTWSQSPAHTSRSSDDQLPAPAVAVDHVDVVKQKDRFSFKIPNTNFVQGILSTVLRERNQFGCNSCVHRYEFDQHGSIVAVPPNQTVIVEFSSPNIAKPFHAGHLRSTILGNVLSNLYSALGHKVIRLNWLGDWGTQFGLLAVGFERYGSQQHLQESSINHLFEVYVKINADVEREKSSHPEGHSDTFSQGLQAFQLMENGDESYLKLWKQFRRMSIEEYTSIYQRLGVQFDEYHGEAMYIEDCHKLVKNWTDRGLLQRDDTTGVGYLDVQIATGQCRATVVKSDGTTLYLTRDIAALLDRHRKYKFNKIHYCVEQGQYLHFQHIVGLMKKLGHSWINGHENDLLVGFGRVHGMQTRKGNVVFLRDILDEAKKKTEAILHSKETTKITDNFEKTADILGISAIVVRDLKERRHLNYKFSWDRVLNFKADSGIFLQYLHARLCSLELNCGVSLDAEFDAACLVEPEAIRVAIMLARYDEVLKKSLHGLEPYVLVHYLFQLGHLTNVAIRCLQVKDQPADIAQARLSLFVSCRVTLANGLRVLGIHPLKQM